MFQVLFHRWMMQTRNRHKFDSLPRQPIRHIKHLPSREPKSIIQFQKQLNITRENGNYESIVHNHD